MDPITAMIALSITGYVIGGVVTDAAAVIQRKDPPSLQKWRGRHEAKQARGERSDPNPGYWKRVVGNAAERWAEKSDYKHERRKAWLAEQEPKRSAKWLARKRKRAERAERAAARFKERFNATREEWAERRAWAENARRGDYQVAPYIDEQGRGHPGWWQSERGYGWELPVIYDQAGNAWYVHPDGSHSVCEEPSPEVEDALDEQSTLDNVVPFPPRGETAESQQEDSQPQQLVVINHHHAKEENNPDTKEGNGTSTQETTKQHRDDDGANNGGEDEQPDGDLAAAEPVTSSSSEESAMSVSPEITNLTQARTYTGHMQHYLNDVHAGTESNTADLRQQSKDIAAERANAELAAASARSQGMQGEQVAKLDQAVVALNQVETHFANAVQALEGLPDAVTTASSCFSVAKAKFDQQTGIAEQVQAAGNDAAKDTDFYANA